MPSASAAFSTFVDEFFDGYFRLHPTLGTASGLHSYDAFLEDFSAEGQAKKIDFYRSAKAKLGGFDRSNLSRQEWSDRRLLEATVKADLLELEEVRMWQKNPDRYSSEVTATAFLLISRTFAPPEARLRSLIARERGMPALFAAAKKNLKNPPKVYTEVAIEQLPGMIEFFERDVRRAFAGVKDEALLAEFQRTNAEVITALNDYLGFLKQDLLPRSNGSFRLGDELYRRKLLFEEMIDTPLAELKARGYADLQRNQRLFRETAAKLDASVGPAVLLSKLRLNHPSRERLIPTFEEIVKDTKRFIEEKHIVTIPSEVLPRLEETPPFLRALTSASMEIPGPFEDKATEAFFNVTLPEKDWSPEKARDWLEGFNLGVIVATAIHEAYPGHYVQFLWVKQAPSKVRKLLGANSNAEGWAHYCEEMLLDEGYGQKEGGRAYLEYRLGQLQDALLRNARYIVGLEMHTGAMTLAEGTRFFEQQGYQTRAVSEREAKRGTSDPTYLVYTLGKLEILKLREDYRKMRGAAFSLKEFHDAFLQEGYPPIALVREALFAK